jgi:hypothetical protein
VLRISDGLEKMKNRSNLDLSLDAIRQVVVRAV